MSAPQSLSAANVAIAERMSDFISSTRVRPCWNAHVERASRGKRPSSVSSDAFRYSFMPAESSPSRSWRRLLSSTKPVRCLIAYAPGGGTDIFVRLVAQSLPSRLGQPFILENRPGAASNIATEMVARAPADGYTLLGTDSSAAINVTLYSNLSFNFIRDIAMVAMARGPLVLAVHPWVPAMTVPELIAYAKKNPGKINFGSSGVGSSLHMAGELFKFMGGRRWLGYVMNEF